MKAARLKYVVLTAGAVLGILESRGYAGVVSGHAVGVQQSHGLAVGEEIDRHDTASSQSRARLRSRRSLPSVD